MADYTKAEIEPPLRALLDYCVRLTLELSSVGPRDVAELRENHGWSDAAIHDAVQVTGFFNYYTRLADGLGVEPEEFMGGTTPLSLPTLRGGRKRKGTSPTVRG